jgi:hypothetical protein
LGGQKPDWATAVVLNSKEIIPARLSRHRAIDILGEIIPKLIQKNRVATTGIAAGFHKTSFLCTTSPIVQNQLHYEHHRRHIRQADP